MTDLEELCRKSDSSLQSDDSGQKIILKYLNRPYQLSFPEITILAMCSSENVELRDKILILHY
jgi:hypothetical protein